jgi:hypothetical protein
MAGARLMTVDRTPSTSLVLCRVCGWRELVTDPAKVQTVKDLHRRDVHPIQAASLAAHRRTRGRPVIL